MVEKEIDVNFRALWFLRAGEAEGFFLFWL